MIRKFANILGSAVKADLPDPKHVGFAVGESESRLRSEVTDSGAPNTPDDVAERLTDSDVADVVGHYNELHSLGKYEDANRFMLDSDLRLEADAIVKEHLARSFHFVDQPGKEASNWWSAFDMTGRLEFAACAIRAWTRAEDFEAARSRIAQLQAVAADHCDTLSAIAEFFEARRDNHRSGAFWRLAVSVPAPDRNAFRRATDLLVREARSEGSEAATGEVISILDRGLAAYPDDVELLKRYIDVSETLGLRSIYSAFDQLTQLAIQPPFAWKVSRSDLIETFRRKAWLFYEDNDLEGLQKMVEQLPKRIDGDEFDDSAFFLELRAMLALKAYDWDRARIYAREFEARFPNYAFGRIALTYTLAAFEKQVDFGRQIELLLRDDSVSHEQKTMLERLAVAFQRSLPPNQISSARVVVDITGLSRSLRLGGDIGGIERTVAEIALALCESGHMPIVLVNWKTTAVEVIEADLRRALFQPEADHINPLLQTDLSPGERRFSISPHDTVFVLGSAWQYDPLNSIMQMYKDGGAKLVLFVHDLLQLSHSEIVAERGSDSFGRWAGTALDLADTVVANSHFSCEQIHRFRTSTFKRAIPVRKIELGDDFRSVAPRRASTDKRSTFNSVLREGASSGFVLYVSSIFKRKNHAFLVRAWTKLRMQFSSECPLLVIVGNPGDAMGALNRAMIQTNCASGRAAVLHGVNDEQLKALYDGCLFTVFPSLCEGWGLPIAESLAHGKACIATNVTALPEVGGDLVDYFEPGDEAMFLRLVAKNLTLEARTAREARIKKEYKVRKWKNSAEELINYCVEGTRFDNPTYNVQRSQCGIILVCGSWNRQCGIARYTAHVDRALRDAGYRVHVVRSIQDCRALLASGLFGYIIVQHEYGLYDKINLDLLGPDTTDALLVTMRDYESNYPALRQAIVMHTIDMTRADFRPQTSALLSSSIALVSLSSTASRSTRSIFMEHGTQAPPDAESRDTTGSLHDRNSLRIAYFGFLSPMKRVDKFLQACASANATVIANFASHSPELIEETRKIANDLNVRGEITYDFLSDAELSKLLNRADVSYLPQAPISYWATTGSARVSLSANRPVITSPEDQFADMAEAAIFATESTFADVVERLRNPDFYSQACARARNFRSSNSFVEVYRRLFQQLDTGCKRLAPPSIIVSSDNIAGMELNSAAKFCYRNFMLRDPDSHEVASFIHDCEQSVPGVMQAVVRFVALCMGQGFDVDIDLTSAFEEKWVDPWLNDLAAVDRCILTSAIDLLHLDGDLFESAAWATLAKRPPAASPTKAPSTLHAKLNRLRAIRTQVNEGKPLVTDWGGRSSHLHLFEVLPSDIQQSRTLYRLSHLACAEKRFRPFVAYRSLLKREPSLDEAKHVLSLNMCEYVNHLREMASRTSFVKIDDDIADPLEWERRHKAIVEFAMSVRHREADELTGDNLALREIQTLGRKSPLLAVCAV